MSERTEVWGQAWNEWAGRKAGGSNTAACAEMDAVALGSEAMTRMAGDPPGAGLPPSWRNQPTGGGGANTLAKVRAYVEHEAERGEQACGAKASPWDCAYYAAVAVFGADDARCRLMADYVVAALDEVQQ